MGVNGGVTGGRPPPSIPARGPGEEAGGVGQLPIHWDHRQFWAAGGPQGGFLPSMASLGKLPTRNGDGSPAAPRAPRREGESVDDFVSRL